jgi:20S proteasome subunit beta 4
LFYRYINKNLKLYELSNDGTKLSTHAQANFARGELATALRKGPYQVNILLGGYDEKVGGSLYFLDYMASLQKVPYGAQGHAAAFCLSIMDREYLPGKCTEEAALKILRQCIHELKVRFLISQPNFIIKKVDKEGVTVVDFGADPADN